jgi:hypothetical protein
MNTIPSTLYPLESFIKQNKHLIISRVIPAYHLIVSKEYSDIIWDACVDASSGCCTGCTIVNYDEPVCSVVDGQHIIFNGFHVSFAPHQLYNILLALTEEHEQLVTKILQSLRII